MASTFPAVQLDSSEAVQLLQPDTIRQVMRRAADYQLKIQADDKGTSRSDINYEWVRGVFYTSIPALYDATGDQKYLDAAYNYARSRKWKLDIPDTRHADWQCVGQLYLDLYLREQNPAKRDPQMIAGIRNSIDAQIAAPRPGREDWWWCDALYMAPPVLTRLYAATGDRKYLDYLNTMYWDAQQFLYNEQEALFYRDKSFFSARSRNGRGVYWSRGNGWVLAGLARLMEYLPQTNPGRLKFESLFRDMSSQIAELQGDDGLWRTNLLDPDEFPTGETSGTAFFVFAMAWGISNGQLDRQIFEPVVKRGWIGLARAVTPDGKLGYVQTVAAGPGEVNAEDSREYAVGGLLLAESELLKIRHRS